MQLTIRAFDRLHRLSRGRRARSFLNVKDEDLVQKIAAEVGLEAKSDSTREVIDYVFQDNESNLEFLQRREPAVAADDGVLARGGGGFHPQRQKQAAGADAFHQLVQFGGADRRRCRAHLGGDGFRVRRGGADLSSDWWHAA